MARVARRVHDKQVLRLIRRYLEAGVMADGLVHVSEEGTPQGSPTLGRSPATRSAQAAERIRIMLSVQRESPVNARDFSSHCT
jgi:hypothetical protein